MTLSRKTTPYWLLFYLRLVSSYYLPYEVASS
jgi:hypothetical protein